MLLLLGGGVPHVTVTKLYKVGDAKKVSVTKCYMGGVTPLQKPYMEFGLS